MELGKSSMSNKVRITSGIVRVRGHFMTKLTERQWAIANHALNASEAITDADVRSHLTAAQGVLHQIAGSAAILGFDGLGDHASRIEKLVDLFFLKGLGTVHCNKLLTDVIMEITDFVSMCEQMTSQPTVLEYIEVPSPNNIVEHTG